MENQYDIAIIGLGPAGSTLARLLSNDFKIIAIDKKNNLGQEGFHKPCGGLLAPDAQKAIAEMGLSLYKDILVDPQIFSVRTMDFDSGITNHYPRGYINMDRHKFDLWMKSLIPSSVEINHHSFCQSIEKTERGYKITYINEGKTHIIGSRIIVGADGAKSMVRNFLYPDKKLNSYLSIQQWFNAEVETPFYSCIFDSKNTDCYSWGLFKDKYFIFGGAYPMDNARERFENQKKSLIDRGYILGEAIKTEACIVLRPKNFRDFATGYENAFLIGEAAGFISPSSLEGISYGINSGRILAEVLNSNGKGLNQEYNKKTLKIKLVLMTKVLKSLFLYNPFLRNIVMLSKVTAINVETKI